MDGMRHHRSRTQAARAVIHVRVIERVGEEPMDLCDLVAILGEVRLPVRTCPRRERRGFAQHVRGAADGEARRYRVAQPSVVAPMPSLDRSALWRRLVSSTSAVRAGWVIAQAIHHDLADHRPNAVRLGGFERRIQARLEDRAVHERRGRRPRRPSLERP